MTSNSTSKTGSSTARQLAWGFHEKSGLRDHFGYAGPWRWFTLSQMGTPDRIENRWIVISHILPSKIHHKSYTDVEKAKDDCQEVINRFARWIGEHGEAPT